MFVMRVTRVRKTNICRTRSERRRFCLFAKRSTTKYLSHYLNSISYAHLTNKDPQFGFRFVLERNRVCRPAKSSFHGGSLQ